MQKYLELRVKETDYVADAIATRISSQGRRGDRFHWPKLLRTQPTPPVNARHAKVRAKDTSEVRSDHRRLEGRRRVVPFLEYYGDDVVSDVPLSFHLPERTDQRRHKEEEEKKCHYSMIHMRQELSLPQDESILCQLGAKGRTLNTSLTYYHLIKMLANGLANVFLFKHPWKLALIWSLFAWWMSVLELLTMSPKTVRYTESRFDWVMMQIRRTISYANCGDRRHKVLLSTVIASMSCVSQPLPRLLLLITSTAAANDDQLPSVFRAPTLFGSGKVALSLSEVYLSFFNERAAPGEPEPKQWAVKTKTMSWA